MGSDYEDICRQNIGKYGTETSHLDLLSKLYTDKTHFIYELLQNAEDAKASSVHFRLYNDHLQVAHDGRAFTEADVVGICGVAEGTKADDVTKIGRFGVGFKSVFTYSSAPEVHSASEHFLIRNFVRPEAADRIDVPDPWTTIFVLQFDQEQTQTTAQKDIENRLRNLSSRTLLFLEHIEEISWQAPADDAGTFLRESANKGFHREVTVLGQVGTETTETESWIIFSRQIHKGDLRLKPVEMAFRLKDGEPRVIEPVDDSRLVVFFPTELETHLGFLLQGPFVTTPSRDNIPIDHDWNRRLVSEASEMLELCLESIKSLGLLSVGALRCLPLNPAKFDMGSRFRPLFDAAKSSLSQQELLPALEVGEFVSSRRAILGRSAEFRRVFSPDRLAQVFGLDPDSQWITSDITENTAPELRWFLMQELEVREIDGAEFARRVNDEFFAAQTDSWLSMFYEFLLDQPALWRTSRGRSVPPLLLKKYVRLENGSHAYPIGPDGELRVYLPTPGSSLRCVKQQVLENEGARKFFKALGLTLPDPADLFLEKVLAQYRSSPRSGASPVTLQQHKKHMEQLLELLETLESAQRNRLIQKCSELPFLVGDPNLEDSTRKYLRPERLYQRTAELELLLVGVAGVYFLSDVYGSRIDSIVDYFGIASEVSVTRRLPNALGYVVVDKSHGYHRRGVDGFDPGTNVPFLAEALARPSLEKSLYVWRQFVLPLRDQVRGKVQFSTRAAYDSITEDVVESSFGEVVLESYWLPTKELEFRRPKDLSITELHEDFANVGLVSDVLGIEGGESAKLADSLGVSVDDIEFLKQIKRDPIAYNELKAKWRPKPAFPSKEVKNPKRRGEQIQVKVSSSPDVRREKRARTVRISANSTIGRVDLKAIYTNSAGQMVCQLCKDEMPFRKKDGDYYFEAVQLIPDPPKEFDGINSIALCPNCSAKFREYVTNRFDQGDLLQLIRGADSNRVVIEMDRGAESLEFVESHFHDLLAAISAFD